MLKFGELWFGKLANCTAAITLNDANYVLFMIESEIGGCEQLQLRQS